MNYPIKEVLRKLELIGRMVAWPIKLAEFDIHYKPCGLMQTQFMAEFLAEFTGNDTTTREWWTLYVDKETTVPATSTQRKSKGGT